MIWTLKLCMGLVWGMCGTVTSYDFASKEECYREQARLDNKPGVTYAICSPKPGSKG